MTEEIMRTLIDLWFKDAVKACEEERDNNISNFSISSHNISVYTKGFSDGTKVVFNRVPDLVHDIVKEYETLIKTKYDNRD